MQVKRERGKSGVGRRQSIGGGERHNGERGKGPKKGFLSLIRHGCVGPSAAAAAAAAKGTKRTEERRKASA